MDLLDLLAVQGTLQSLLQQHSSKAILLHSAFFIVQLSHPYLTTGKTIALTRWTFDDKVMSLLFTMLSRMVCIFGTFSYLEPVYCYTSSSNCCFLTCIQVSQEAHQGVRYSHLFKNFPQFFVIHTVKDFLIVNKAEIHVFLELSCFFNDSANLVI